MSFDVDARFVTAHDVRDDMAKTVVRNLLGLKGSPTDHLRHQRVVVRDLVQPVVLEDIRPAVPDDDFLAALGHELRNPFAAITTAATLLEQRMGSDATAKRPLEVIMRQSRHVSRLVDDLLDTTRIGRGKLQIEKQMVDLRSLVTEIIDTKWGQANHDGRHSVSVDLGDIPLFVEADPIRLTQVFTNLIDNASKFTPDGGRISVTATAKDGVVNIEVRDTGIGLPADQLRRIFDPFTQLPDPYDPSQSGLGLGLSLVRGLTELHGGTVHVASAGPGQGSCFTVRLPAA